MGIDFVVEGVETIDEFTWFSDLGVNLYQGYLFAKPKFEAMPPFHIPDLNGETIMKTGSEPLWSIQSIQSQSLHHE